MKKKVKNIDFILSETNDTKTIFRFLPRKSHCHGFGDEPPTCWRAVYKVYYAYQVLKIWSDEEFGDETYVIYDENCDECSIIDEVATRCKLIAEGKEDVTVTHRGFNNKEITHTIQLLNNEMLPMGNGTCWTIEIDPDRKRHPSGENLYKISLFDDINNNGCRFWLTKDELAKFGEYLDGCCEYMLEHGEPI